MAAAALEAFLNIPNNNNNQWMGKITGSLHQPCYI